MKKQDAPPMYRETDLIHGRQKLLNWYRVIARPLEAQQLTAHR
ncbi:hypothetical protein BH24BAC1_BH24BAC1_35960 [soil metagenome]